MMACSKLAISLTVLLLSMTLQSPALVSTCNGEDRPNIVFLMTDDQCTFSLGCYGNHDVKTPNLDRLAAAGMVFDSHYANTAICMASRATVMTGLYEYRTGCNFQHGSMLQSTWKQSYPVLLRSAGYRTAFAGKFGFELKLKPENKKNLPLPTEDFDLWGGGPGQTNYKTARNESMKQYSQEFPHSTMSYGAFGTDFIARSARLKKPFCLSISFKAPHKPATPDPRFDGVYRDVKFRKPANFGREAGTHFAVQSKMDRQYERFYSWNYADRYDDVMSLYHQQIHGVDSAVGMILDALNEHAVADNTVIIFTSDNGFFCGSHGYGSKVLPYEESSRIPLIVLDPRQSNSGKKIRCGSLSGLIDIYPTILELAGLESKHSIDGKSLMNLYRIPDSTNHEDMALINVWGHPATHSLSVVTQNKKYIYWPYSADDMQATEEMYDLANDAGEMENHADSPEHQKMLIEMRKRYNKHLNLWKQKSVSHNNYQQYGTIFDRDVGWDSKAPLYPNQSNR